MTGHFISPCSGLVKLVWFQVMFCAGAQPASGLIPYVPISLHPGSGSGWICDRVQPATFTLTASGGRGSLPALRVVLSCLSKPCSSFSPRSQTQGSRHSWWLWPRWQGPCTVMQPTPPGRSWSFFWCGARGRPGGGRHARPSPAGPSCVVCGDVRAVSAEVSMRRRPRGLQSLAVSCGPLT